MNKGIKRKFKDVIFVDLFQDPEYIILLYKDIHPEDQDVIAEDIENVNLKNILVNDVYNDLGFIVKDKFIIMVEAQSSWSPNIVIRALIYLFDTYKEYIQKNKLDVYGDKAVKLPKPELYVIYTGSRKEKPEKISFKEVYFPEEENLFIDGFVKMLYDNSRDGIICQYNSLVHTIEEQLTKYEDPLEGMGKAIEICMEKGILSEYLKKRRQEVLNKMAEFWDEQNAREIYEYNLRKEAKDEGIQEGMQKGMQKGKQEGILEERINSIRNMVDSLKELNISAEDITVQLKKKYSLTDKDIQTLL